MAKEKRFYNPFHNKFMFIKQHGRIFDLKIPKTLKIVYVWGKGLSLFANKEFKEGDKIIYLKGKLVNAANSYARSGTNER